MNRFHIPAFLITMALAAAPFAQAQFGPQNRYSPDAVTSLIGRVHEDLNHAYGVWHFSDSDRDRLNHTEKELREFAQKWSHSKFDKGELDDAIGALQDVLDHNKLPQPNRDALSDDITQLRNMRTAYDHHEIGA